MTEEKKGLVKFPICHSWQATRDSVKDWVNPFFSSVKDWVSSLFTIYSPILISRACRIILGDAERKIRIRENSELGLEIREIMW